MKVYADVSEFSRGVYDLLTSGDYKKFINQHQFADNPIFVDGFMQGLAWSVILLNGNYANYFANEGDITDAPNNE